MKILNLGLGILLFTSVAQAQAEEICLETEQPAVSPDGVCEVFNNSCEVPSDWKAIPNCSLVSGEGREARLSLEEKMKQRLANFRERLKAKRAAQGENTKDLRANDKSRRMASGAYTRTNARNNRLSTKEDANNSTRKLRTSTQRNYNQIGIRKAFSNKGGYKDESKVKPSTTAYDRPAQISSTTIKRSGDLKTTTKWTTLQRQHMRQRSYGKNPYSLKSRYSASQKEARDKTNKAVDVQARLRSGYKIWRGERDDANIDQELVD